MKKLELNIEKYFNKFFSKLEGSKKKKIKLVNIKNVKNVKCKKSNLIVLHLIRKLNIPSIKVR